MPIGWEVPAYLLIPLRNTYEPFCEITQVTPMFFQELQAQGHMLKHLSMQDCKQVTDDWLPLLQSIVSEVGDSVPSLID